MDSLGEMEECLETYTFPRLNQEETNYWTLITSNEIESIIKNLQQTKDQDHARIGEFLPNIKTRAVEQCIDIQEAFFFFLSSVESTKGFPGSSVGKESTCN